MLQYFVIVVQNEHVHANGSHKYLGRKLQGMLRERGAVALQHRVSCAWAKFRELQDSLVNKHVDVRLRLKLFDAAVSASVLYSLDTCPITASQLKKLDAVQNRMLRRIVGWVSFEDEPWEEIGRRMKVRLQRALALHPVSRWSDRIHNSKVGILNKVRGRSSTSHLLCLVLVPACLCAAECRPARTGPTQSAG